MLLRRLNETGISQFLEYLASLRDEPDAMPPYSLLDDPQYSEELEYHVEVQQRSFSSRFDAAEYFHGLFSDSGIKEIERDKGIWTWLSLFFFEEVCPPDETGKRKPLEIVRYIPEITDWRKYYRHLLAGPYRIFAAHKDNPARAMALLCNPLSKPGDLVEQLASRQELVTNKAIVEAATELYVDKDTGKPKRGSQSKGNGAVRRLADIINQFDVTWDLYSMECAEVLALLPEEFNRFK
ncbi:MAG: hypothetical protein AB1442_17770 [Nitrospirota bacterium]